MKENFHLEENHTDRRACDIAPFFCRATNIGSDKTHPLCVPKETADTHWPTKVVQMTPPPWALRHLNRCQLSSEALGSVAFSLAPIPLELDGVAFLHALLFEKWRTETDPLRRLQWFEAHMRAHFCLEAPEQAGFSDKARLARPRMDYLRLLRGWMFDAQGQEGALLKAWVESRFGLLAHFHRREITPSDDENTAHDDNGRSHFEQFAARSLYGTVALEAQIDLLYAFAQSELEYQHPGQTHIRLYRGVPPRAKPKALAHGPQGEEVVLLNNLSSFSCNLERADEFGDAVFACRVPLAKILAFSGLFPSRLKGEDEYLVMGGLVPITWVR
jgi:NAD+---dinitrogen-reductase ADP-D-ribosyltransferase